MSKPRETAEPTDDVITQFLDLYKLYRTGGVSLELIVAITQLIAHLAQLAAGGDGPKAFAPAGDVPDLSDDELVAELEALNRPRFGAGLTDEEPAQIDKKVAFAIIKKLAKLLLTIVLS